MNQEALEAIGLTKNESITYLTLLKIGQSKTGNILKQSKLNSGKIYEILEALKQKGLVSEISIDGVKHFTAAPPNQLEQFLQLKKEKIAQEESQVKQLIPQLEILQKEVLPNKRIITYTGFKGIITAAEEALNQTEDHEEIISLGISDVNAWSQDYWHKWELERAKKKINARYILSQKGVIYKDIEEMGELSIRVLELNTPVGIDIYGNKIVLILHYQDPVSVTAIYDEHTATTFKSYFEVLWKVAKK